MAIISVIVPIYNSESYLEQCIDSILNQTFQDFELLLIDDGSTDNSLQICLRYSQKDNRIHSYTQRGSGPSAARNRGLDYARGVYITFVDSDDYLNHDALEILYNAMREGAYDLVRCSFQCVGLRSKLNAKELPDMVAHSKHELAQIYYKNYESYLHANVWGKLYRTSIIKEHKIKFKENIHVCEDRIFNVEYAQYANTATLLKYIGYNYVDRGNISLVQRADLNTLEGTLEVFVYEKEYFSKLVDKFDPLVFSNQALASLSGCLRRILKTSKIIDKKNLVQKTVDDYRFKTLVKDAKISYSLRWQDIIYIGIMKNCSPHVIYILLSLINIINR